VATLGFEALFTIVVPGSIVLASFLLILRHCEPTSQLFMLADSFRGDDWIMGPAILVGSVAFGGMLATLMGLIEEPVLDRISAWRMRITNEEFTCEWNKYVACLDDKNNPYVARLAMFFFFESRMALSLFAMSVAVGIDECPCGWPFASFLVFLAACAFAISSATAHHELAKYRHRTFPCIAEKRTSNDTSPGK
jgi:hypothetical protein